MEIMSPDTPKAEHDTKLDSAGWGERTRLTCHSCGETCLKQPYMGRKEWREKVSKFTAAHPSEAGEKYNKLLAPLQRAKGLNYGKTIQNEK